MRPQRSHRTLVIAVACLACVPAVASAHSTTTEHVIRQLGRHLLYVAVPVTLLTEFALGYTIWRFRDKDEPDETPERRRIEIGWTVATALILLFVGSSAYVAMGEPMVTPTRETVERELGQEETVVVNVTGIRWYWRFTYPKHDLMTRNELVLPANRTIVLRIRSADVIHSVYAPELGLKKDAVPGMTNYLVTRISRDAAGKNFTLYCAEFCGTGHSDMLATVRVVSPERYREWLARNGSLESRQRYLRPEIKTTDEDQPDDVDEVPIPADRRH